MDYSARAENNPIKVVPVSVFIRLRSVSGKLSIGLGSLLSGLLSIRNLKLDYLVEKAIGTSVACHRF